MQDTMATELAHATVAAGWPWAARWADGVSSSALAGTGAPFGEAP